MLFDRIKFLCEQRKISITELEERVGFGKNSIYKWKTQMPKIDKLQAIADYFDVTTDYLLGRTDTPEFTKRDEKDIQNTLSELLEGLSDKNALAYLKNGGEEIDEEDAELLRDALERAARRAKILAKEKFNPHKNGK